MNSNDKGYNHAITADENPIRANQTQDSDNRKNKSLKEYFREYCDKTCVSELYLSRKWWIHGIKYALREKFTKQQKKEPLSVPFSVVCSMCIYIFNYTPRLQKNNNQKKRCIKCHT